MMTNIIRIGKHHIGDRNATYIVAEMPANHNQDFDNAVKILEAAKSAGADDGKHPFHQALKWIGTQVS